MKRKKEKTGDDTPDARAIAAFEEAVQVALSSADLGAEVHTEVMVRFFEDVEVAMARITTDTETRISEARAEARWRQ